MLRDIKIGTKLVLAFGLVLFVFLVAVLGAVSSVSDMARDMDDFEKHAYQVAVTAMKMQDTTMTIQRDLLLANNAGDVEDVREILERIERLSEQRAEEHAIVRKLLPGHEAHMDKIEECFTRSSTVRKTIGEYLLMDDPGQRLVGMYLLENQYIPLIDYARELIEETVEIAGKQAEAYAKRAEQTQKSARNLLIGTGSIGMLIMIWMGIWISVSVRRPVKHLLAAAADIRHGNLDTTIAYQSKDELGQLADALRETVKNLHAYVAEIDRVLTAVKDKNLAVLPEIEFEGDFLKIDMALREILSTLNARLRGIGDSAAQVESGAMQVSAGAQALAQGAAEQTASVQELALNIDQISEQLVQTAQASRHATEQSERVGEELRCSNDRMKAAQAAMTNIQQSAKRIRGIIKTIEDIAFQTNILSLNAAVEAARAGSAGKGFAVVADEVRNLANKSAQEATNTAVLVESTLKMVDDGMAATAGTAEALGEVVLAMADVNRQAEGVVRTTQAQAEAIGMIKTSVSEISNVVLMNSSTAEESAATSEQLLNQAGMLSDVIAEFHLLEKEEETMW
ncbi:methyl-accepting chemotaxis protein [Christensenellaceae bacterium OttesenSCG-928-L17]|nr:methyl-accepting chemotaxis protein [Christensenellaceae bacterium OttesenSCG-928-L17]